MKGYGYSISVKVLTQNLKFKSIFMEIMEVEVQMLNLQNLKLNSI
jgi:hypothetical protein